MPTSHTFPTLAIHWILAVLLPCLVAGCQSQSWGKFWETGAASANCKSSDAACLAPGTPPVQTVLASPTGLANAGRTTTSITLTWAAVSGASGYKLYRSATSGGTLSLLGSPVGTSLADTGLTANTTYYYKVSATNAAGESPLSAEVAIATFSIPNLDSVVPNDGATFISTGTSIVLTFSEAIAPVTIDATSGGPCAAQTVLISQDTFVNCYGFSAAFSVGNTVVTLTQVGSFPNNTIIKIRVTTAVQSANAVPLNTQYESTTGFTTTP